MRPGAGLDPDVTSGRSVGDADAHGVGGSEREIHASLTGQVWKLGQFAAVTGLTVRTLHHYDQIGLVSPSRRTPSGHRLCEESDVRRLYQVLALRQLGLSLDPVARVVAGAASMSEVLAAHQAYLEQQLCAMRRLRAQVSTLAATAQETPQASVEDFLELMRGVIVVDDTVKQYFSEAQLADLAERRERLGDQAISDVEVGWRSLLPRVAAAVESGLDLDWTRPRRRRRPWPSSGWRCSSSSTAATTACVTAYTGCRPRTPSASSGSTADHPPTSCASSNSPTRHGSEPPSAC